MDSPLSPSRSQSEEEEEEEAIHHSLTDSPLSPSLSQYEEDEEEPSATFCDLFFSEAGVPFGFNPQEDAFLLDPNYVDSSLPYNSVKRYISTHDIFARNIRSYENGSIISRHRESWGNLNVLFLTEFTIVKKIYRSKGSELAFVLIKEVESPHREYMIEPPFFEGWLDADGKKKALDFMLS